MFFDRICELLRSFSRFLADSIKIFWRFLKKRFFACSRRSSMARLIAAAPSLRISEHGDSDLKLAADKVSSSESETTSVSFGLVSWLRKSSTRIFLDTWVFVERVALEKPRGCVGTCPVSWRRFRAEKQAQVEGTHSSVYFLRFSLFLLHLKHPRARGEF